MFGNWVYRYTNPITTSTMNADSILKHTVTIATPTLHKTFIKNNLNVPHLFNSM